MLIDLSDYYDIGNVSWWKSSVGATLYDIELISKSTGEVVVWTFDEERFDKLLKQLEANLIVKNYILKELRNEVIS